jgi:hypothetical protein
VRAGRVRVLLGSTQKMGTGTNVQKRLVALHHLDAPWKPAEVEQREGRILRQGNENEEVAVYRYVTEGSFDAYMWQALETKARFIAQVICGDNAVRRAEDIGGQELSYAEVKAIASGNPAVLTLAEADAEIQRLAVLRKNHADEQYLARRSLRELPGRIDSLSERIAGLTADMATLAAHAGDRIAVGAQAVSDKDAPAVLGQRLEALPQRVQETRRVKLGTYHGLVFGMVLHPQWRPEVYLEGAVTRQDTLSREHQGARAVLNALERLARGYGVEVAGARRDLDVAQAQLRDYQARVGQEFAHRDYLDRLTDLRDQLRCVLSGAAPAGEGQQQPDAAELAKQIEAIKGTHTIDTTPARSGKRRTTAEEPVTVRIRQRTQAPTTDVTGPEVAESRSSLETVI